MILDDRELGNLFRARAAAFPEPSADLFSLTLHRLDARTPGSRSIMRRVRSMRFAALNVRVGGVLAVTVAACIVLVATFGRQNSAQPPFPYVQAPLLEKTETEKIDPSFAAEPAAPRPKQIKINTLKTTSSASGAVASDAASALAPAAAPAPDAAIARAETLALLVRSVPESIATLNAIARTHGGFVTKIDDNAPDDPDSPRTATLSLIVAAPQLDAATARILALGAIQSRSATAEAIGDSIVDDQARLRNLRREETDLLHIMDRSGSVSSILDVESKLADVRGQIEQLTAHLATSNHRVATSQIDITLTESKPAPAPAKPSLGDHAGATWNAALRSVIALGVGIADFAIWLVAYLPVLAAVAIIVGVIAYRQRSRF